MGYGFIKYTKKNERILYTTQRVSKEYAQTHEKKKKLERDLVRTFSRAGEQLRVLRASYRRYFVRPVGAAKLAGPGTERPARRQRRVGKKIPSPPLPRNSSALPSASSRSCPCRRTSLSLVSSSSWCARSLRVCLPVSLLFESRDLRFDTEFKKRLALEKKKRKHVVLLQTLLIKISTSSGASGS